MQHERHSDRKANKMDNINPILFIFCVSLNYRNPRVSEGIYEDFSFPASVSSVVYFNLIPGQVTQSFEVSLNHCSRKEPRTLNRTKTFVL